MLNAAAKVNLVTCPMYVQWAGNEVLTCRSAAELWRDTRNSAAKSIMRKHTRRWGLGDIPRAVWIVVFGRKGAEEGSRSSNYGTQVSNQASPSPRPKGPGGGVRRQLRKLREFKWEEVKDGAMHVMIHGRRGPALVACIRDWLLQQIDASSSSVATGVHAHWDQDSALSDMHEDHATEPAYEELLGSQEIPSDCDLTPNVKSRGARDVAFEHTQDYDECSDTAHGRSTAVESSTRNVKKRRTTAVDIQVLHSSLSCFLFHSCFAPSGFRAGPGLFRCASEPQCSTSDISCLISQSMDVSGRSAYAGTPRHFSYYDFPYYSTL